MRVLLALVYVLPSCWCTEIPRCSTQSITKSPSSSPPHLYYEPQVYAFQELKFAVEKGMLSTVLSLLKGEDRSMDPSQDQNFCLWYAASKGYVELVSVLLEDERVDPREPENRAIRMAASEGHINVVKILLADRRLTADAVNEVLRLGCEFGNEKIVRLALDSPIVNINKRFFSVFYTTSLNMSCARGNLEIVHMLLDDKRLIPDQNFTESPLVEAVAYPNILRMLIADGRAVPVQKALLTASMNGYTESVKILLAHPEFDPGFNQSEALGAAVMACRTDIVRILLKHPKTDPTADSHRDLGKLSPCRNLPGFRDIVKLLLLHPKVNLYSPKVYEALPSKFKEHFKLIQAVKSESKLDADITDWEIFEWILIFCAKNKRTDLYEQLFKTLIWSKEPFDTAAYPVLANIQKLILFTAINQKYDYVLPKELVAEIVESALLISFDL